MIIAQNYSRLLNENLTFLGIYKNIRLKRFIVEIKCSISIPSPNADTR